jgi:hypothetical protein
MGQVGLLGGWMGSVPGSAPEACSSVLNLVVKGFRSCATLYSADQAFLVNSFLKMSPWRSQGEAILQRSDYHLFCSQRKLHSSLSQMTVFVITAPPLHLHDSPACFISQNGPTIHFEVIPFFSV